MMKKSVVKKFVCFRRWSRKKTSILVSLSKVIKIGVLCASYSLVNQMPVLKAQPDTTSIKSNAYELDEVEIIGQRSQVVSSEISRIVTVIRHEEIEKSGIQDISDLLEYVANIDIRQRGPMGIQSDASIRGSSFDHVMILVNGICMSDPQTGHLSLDLPVDFESIERVEVLEGPAARTLGPGAFMGAVNIVTKTGSVNEVTVSHTTGNYAFNRTHLHGGINTGPLQGLISGSRSVSDGYMNNTDHKIYNIYYRGNLHLESATIDLQGGFQDKQFGAGGFYSPVYPEQYEETSTWFTSLKASTGGIFKLTPHVYWRRKKDHFLLKRNDPAFYENFHLTDVYGSRINVTYSGKVFTSAIGMDLRSENIQSNNIGYEISDPRRVRGTDSAYYTKQYQRTNFGVFAEIILNVRNFRITTGGMVNWNTGTDQSPAFFPGVDISYHINRSYTLFASLNRALHLPTFTDLFYIDPVNQGNINLDPDKLIAYEAGIRYSGNVISYSAAGFYNSGDEIIDWLWSYQNNRFGAVNVGNYESYGISANMKLDLSGITAFKLWLNQLSLNYMYLSLNKSIPDSVSKYYNLRHKLSMTINQRFTPNLFLTWNISYQDRYGEVMGYDQPNKRYFSVPYKPSWLVNTAIKWNLMYLQLFAELSNVLNTRYIDAGSTLQPGRWLKAGVVLKLNLK